MTVRRKVIPAPAVSLEKAREFSLFALVLLLSACGSGNSTVAGLPATHACLRTQTPTISPAPPPVAEPPIALRLEPINANLTFPLFLTAPPGDMGRLFVVEKGGVIKIFDLATQLAVATPFLNLAGQIATGGEQGLLGLAFHPDFEQIGFFYVNVINIANGNTEIRRYQVSANDPNQADVASAFLIVTIDQPAGLTNHKAGWLGFGRDGYLYAALGDGGGGGDPDNNAQNLNTLLGKMLRLDVNADGFPADPARNYAIPADNPCVGQAGVAGEIWSIGLRNPWRPSFDRGTGDFYIADVGQDDREEVNISTAADGAGRGINYGWDVMEGSLCFPSNAACSSTGLTLPAVDYDHGSGCSITGGYVYRGSVPALQALRGTYFYGDFCAGFVRSFRLVSGAVTEHAIWPLSPGNITSFGEDAAGELYIMTSGGGLLRIVPE